MKQFTYILTFLFVLTLFFTVHSAPTTPKKRGAFATGNAKDVESTSSASSNAITDGNISGNASGGNGAQTDGQSNSFSSSQSVSSAGASNSGGVQSGNAESGAGAEAGSNVHGQGSASGSNSNAVINGETFGQTDTDTTATVLITNRTNTEIPEVDPVSVAVNSKQGGKREPLCVNGSPQKPVPSSETSPGTESITTGTADAHSEASQQGLGNSSTQTITGSVSTSGGDSISCATAIADATGTEGSQASSTSTVGTASQNSGKTE